MILNACILIAAQLPLLGLLGLGSVLSRIFFGRKSVNQQIAQPTPFPKITFLIPAHNEEKKIGTTLGCIASALPTTDPTAPFAPKIILGLDHCTDQTETQARLWNAKLNIQTVTYTFKSKWKTIHALAHLAETEWVIFLDSGIHFTAETLQNWIACMNDSDALAIAPSYQIQGASRVHHLFWWIERTLKAIENKCGGPISLHGAAIAYRRENLLAAFKLLTTDLPPRFHHQDFKNDDVVIPLALRILFPKQRIRYLPTVNVFDLAVQDKTNYETSLNRRKRMMIGNLQWTRWLFIQPHPIPAAVFLVALRRFLRPFWSVIFAFYSVAFVLNFGGIGLLGFVPILVFHSAARSSFTAPIAWVFRWDEKQTRWN